MHLQVLHVKAVALPEFVKHLIPAKSANGQKKKKRKRTKTETETNGEELPNKKQNRVDEKKTAENATETAPAAATGDAGGAAQIQVQQQVAAVLADGTNMKSGIKANGVEKPETVVKAVVGTKIGDEVLQTTTAPTV